jgi:hypothetical protein
MLEVKQLETNDTINIVNNAWSQTIRNQWYNKLSLVSDCLTSCIIYNVYYIIGFWLSDFMHYLQCLVYHWFLIVWLHKQSETNDTINIANNAWSQKIRNQWYNEHCK